MFMGKDKTGNDSAAVAGNETVREYVIGGRAEK